MDRLSTVEVKLKVWEVWGVASVEPTDILIYFTRIWAHGTKFVPIQGFIQDFVFGERYGRW